MSTKDSDSHSSKEKLLQSWFNLTGEEQKAIILVLALLLLGLAVKFWHLVQTGAIGL